MQYLTKVRTIPVGYSLGRYRERRYGISRQDFNQGRSLKVWAEALDGSDFISFNGYQTQREVYLKPCEMSSQKVLDFLAEVELIGSQTT